MADYTKPLPTADPITAPFWHSVKAHAMQLQRCQSCATFIFYPRALCPVCGSDQLVWTPVSGKGTVHAFTIPHRHPNPAFGTDVPYVVALIELDEGARMLSNLVGIEPTPERVRIGMPVTVSYDEVTDTITLPRFRPR
jgi:uncharacterized protein